MLIIFFSPNFFQILSTSLLTYFMLFLFYLKKKTQIKTNSSKAKKKSLSKNPNQNKNFSKFLIFLCK